MQVVLGGYLVGHAALTVSEEDRKRGDRLFPARSSRVYHVLTQLRMAYERLANSDPAADGDQLIDYGCGNMPYRPLFEQAGFRYVGYDFPGNDKANGDLLKDGTLPLASSTADCVLSSQVLEHVGDPVRYLLEARRVLKPGGRLFLSTHGVWQYHPDPTDFWRWTGDGLRKLVTDCGFDITRFEGIVGPAAIGVQLFQDACVGMFPASLRAVFTWTCQRAMEKIDSRCTDVTRSRDASVFVLIARKPIE